MMNIKQYLEFQRKQFDAEMQELIPRKLSPKDVKAIFGTPRFSFDRPSADKAVQAPIWELLGRGGKRWRPALFLLIAEAFGATPRKLLRLSIIPEIIHNGTLMADDVEDDSGMRRGKPAIHKIFGQDVAINASNTMYFLPILLLKRHGKKFPPKAILAAYEIYVQEMVNLSYGQGFDILWHKGRHAITESDYLQMCAFKTGTLARMAAKLGALFAGAPRKGIRLAGEFAESIGIAFQIQDDILNLTASQEYGKEIGGDISEGKRSIIVLRALSQLDAGRKARLLSILNSHTKNSLVIGEAISLIRGTDALEYSRGKARSLVREAWDKFSRALPGSPAKSRLEEFADYLIEREV